MKPDSPQRIVARVPAGYVETGRIPDGPRSGAARRRRHAGDEVRDSRIAPGASHLPVARRSGA